jgi:hypothetical protein
VALLGPISSMAQRTTRSGPVDSSSRSAKLTDKTPRGPIKESHRLGREDDFFRPGGNTHEVLGTATPGGHRKPTEGRPGSGFFRPVDSQAKMAKPNPHPPGLRNQVVHHDVARHMDLRDARGSLQGMRPVRAQVILACLACTGCPSRETDCGNESYPNQCVDRTVLWQAVASHNGRLDAAMLDAGGADGGVPSGCPTNQQLWGAEVYPDDLGLQGTLFSAPILHPDTDACCYTTYPAPCK